MTEEDGYYYPSDHVLDNMTPEEELAVSIFQQAIAGGKVDPTSPTFNSFYFERCLSVADKLTEILIARHIKADAAADIDPKAKFKVVPITKEVGSERN